MFFLLSLKFLNNESARELKSRGPGGISQEPFVCFGYYLERKNNKAINSHHENKNLLHFFYRSSCLNSRILGRGWNAKFKVTKTSMKNRSQTADLVAKNVLNE
jgi:hypothetical protein